ncbi:unnamed protein product [Acanthosepion pharaonis]|uniref:Uncharacterized protein n=1 Tax=Acanthosepion pharaonis TaxID=158019 RepID=A0A812D5D1_ACAPH|nr:unnamed protein product [Sepia pharaonis]
MLPVPFYHSTLFILLVLFCLFFFQSSSFSLSLSLSLSLFLSLSFSVHNSLFIFLNGCTRYQHMRMRIFPLFILNSFLLNLMCVYHQPDPHHVTHLLTMLFLLSLSLSLSLRVSLLPFDATPAGRQQERTFNKTNTLPCIVYDHLLTPQSAVIRHGIHFT